MCAPVLIVFCQWYTNLVLIYTLACQCFKVCSDSTKFHEELNFLKRVFLKNGTLCYLFPNVLKQLLIIWSKIAEITTIEKKIIIPITIPYLMLLPYLGDISLQTKTKLRTSFKGILNCCEFQIVFKCQL